MTDWKDESAAFEAAAEDLKLAIAGEPKSEADGKALDVLRCLQSDTCLGGDQAVAFIALRQYFAADPPQTSTKATTGRI